MNGKFMNYEDHQDHKEPIVVSFVPFVVHLA
jgi:hypothetical protein